MKKLSTRVNKLASGIFSEMDQLKNEYAAKGYDIINLSVGSPDLPPAPHIVDTLVEAVGNPKQYGYALTEGMKGFKAAVATWYQTRFGVSLDPEKEVLSLMGSQDGLAHIFWAVMDPGDIALIPDPGYPIYSAGVLIADADIHTLPLTKENNFLPDLDAIPEEIAKRAKIMILNYPSNPVAAVANQEFFQRVVDFARKYDIIVCHDVAYSELAFDGFRPISFLETKGAKEVGVEFHSLSKTYNMAGCRLAFVVGNMDVIDALRKIKSNIDYGVFLPVQLAGIAALTGPQDYVRETARVYQRRRDILVEGLNEAGWQVEKPKASMFVWAPLPTGYQDSRAFAIEMLDRTGIVVTPGVAFGQLGEGYVRIALVADETRMQEAVNRIKKGFNFQAE